MKKVAILTLFLLFAACRSLSEKKGDAVVNVPAERPAPTNAEIETEGKKLLEKAFSKCENTQNKDLIYAFAYDEVDKRAYLLEIESFRYEPIPRVPEPNPKEKAEGLDWIGTFVVTAELTGKYDILNRRWIYVGGAGFQKAGKEKATSVWNFPLTKKKGVWKCNECSKYTALDCVKVKELAEETPRY